MDDQKKEVKQPIKDTTRIKIRKEKNDQYKITLPKSIAENQKLKHGDILEIKQLDDKIILKQTKKTGA